MNQKTIFMSKSQRNCLLQYNQTVINKFQELSQMQQKNGPAGSKIEKIKNQLSQLIADKKISRNEKASIVGNASKSPNIGDNKGKIASNKNFSNSRILASPNLANEKSNRNEFNNRKMSEISSVSVNKIRNKKDTQQAKSDEQRQFYTQQSQPQKYVQNDFSPVKPSQILRKQKQKLLNQKKNQSNKNNIPQVAGNRNSITDNRDSKFIEQQKKKVVVKPIDQLKMNAYHEQKPRYQTLRGAQVQRIYFQYKSAQQRSLFCNYFTPKKFHQKIFTINSENSKSKQLQAVKIKQQKDFNSQNKLKDVNSVHNISDSLNSKYNVLHQKLQKLKQQVLISKFGQNARKQEQIERISPTKRQFETFRLYRMYSPITNLYNKSSKMKKKGTKQLDAGLQYDFNQTSAKWNCSKSVQTIKRGSFTRGARNY